MKITTIIFALILFFAGAVVTDSQSLAQSACGGESNSYKLIIHASEERPTRVTHQGQDANDFHVCNGDAVEWQLVGSAKQR